MYSIFDIFKIGIGPSSSHTVAPMRAAKLFIDKMPNKSIEKINKIEISLFGSLAYTGKGHNIEKGLILGLSGYRPDTITSKDNKATYDKVLKKSILKIGIKKVIEFDIDKHILFNFDQKSLQNSNKMIFEAFDLQNKVLSSDVFTSIGGGFIKDKKDDSFDIKDKIDVPFQYRSCSELIKICSKNNLAIDELAFKNEQATRDQKSIKQRIFNIWSVMDESIKSGIKAKGYLRGGLKLRRRAYQIHKDLCSKKNVDNLEFMDWVNLYAIAVNEENAAGGKIVTAPTNGAAGIIPSVMKYYLDFIDDSNSDGIVRFFLVAGTIGILYKMNASISGAEVGCQGEVGVACSMAAGGLASALGASNKEIENAAEIAMEHNLGLTCDPVKGLVQIPCIERNAMGAIKSINAARISMIGKGDHKVSLDDVIKTMMETGKDMQNIYKETSEGGLAVNVTEC
tara:strand:- start:735 stop:2093 length:1359 start_codon:yes stop_codon:yes gene_type:complete